jgi:hypothetical protein
MRTYCMRTATAMVVILLHGYSEHPKRKVSADDCWREIRRSVLMLSSLPLGGLVLPDGVYTSYLFHEAYRAK